MVYSYDKGTRREEGRSNRTGLMQVLRDKHKEIEIMPCSSCNKRRAAYTPPQRAMPSASPLMQINSTNERTVAGMPDSDFVMVEYLPARGGSHGVVGVRVFPTQIAPAMRRTSGGFVFDYGYRSRGDVFLVHVSDAQSAPSLFSPVQVTNVQPAVRLPQPAPQSGLAAPVQQAAPEAAPVETRHTPALPMTNPMPTPFDPQSLPGVSAAIAARMRAAGFTSAEAVVEHADALTQISGVGATKAAAIVTRARELLDASRNPQPESDSVLQELSRILGEDQ
jgi:hypothetical protein